MKICSRAATTGVIAICLFCLVECKKQASPDNSYGLPNATETGANTFGAVLTGIGFYDVSTQYYFVADNDLNDPFYSASGNGAQLNGNALTIAGAPQTGSYFKGITFTITGNLQQGTIYNVDSAGVVAFTGTDSTCMGISLSAVGSIADSGTVQLTKFDTTNKIVSGIFTCNFPYPGCDSTMYVTEGRFDYKYH